jgi:phage FluMu protein gp41
VLESNLVSTLWLIHENERHLTCVHAAFLDAAICAKQYQAAEQHIIDAWPVPDHTTLAAKHVLRYYYLRGMVHMGCENWTMAIRCLYTCICFPSKSVVSAISVAAWKKYILLLCLARGDCASFSIRNLDLPDNASNPLQRLVSDSTNRYHQHKRPSVESSMGMSDRDDFAVAGGAPTILESLSAYNGLAMAFAKVDRAAFDQLVRTHGNAVFGVDGNMGLVERVSAILLRRQLYAIGGVYSTIPIQQLAEDMGLTAEDLLTLLHYVREEKQWPATIDGDFVVFPRRAPQLETTSVIDQTHQEVANLRQLLLIANEAKLEKALFKSKTFKSSHAHSLFRGGSRQSGGEFEL